MVDINKHILTLSTEEAIEIINIFIDRGYTDLILTIPILEDGNLHQQEALEKFYILKKQINGINLYLGNEVSYHFKLIHHLKNNNILTLNNSNYLLLKLPNDEEPLQLNALFDVLKGFNIIISCVDTYKYYSYKDLVEMKNKGALFLIEMKNMYKGKGKKLLKKHLVDFIASYDEVSTPISKPRYLEKEYFEEITNSNFQKILKLDL